MKRVTRIAIAAALCLVVAIPAWSRTNILATEMIGRYFDLLADNNLEIAGDLWTPEALERSSRFGITYTGIPLRVDAVSPIIRYLDRKQTEPILPIRSYEDLPGDWIKMEYAETYGGQLMLWHYYARKIGDWYWLDYPQNYYGADWPVVETEFFRIHAHPEVQVFLNPAVLREADNFIVAIADTLAIPKESLERIRREKIEYFYCGSDQDVKDITGFLGKGQLDLASNDIISSTFPHFHELVHLLVNVRLQEVPLFTLPVLREGLAVRYGGRWGKNASTLLDLAVYLQREGFVAVDSLLTMQGFDSEATADLSYPSVGLFSAFLLDRIGLDKYLDLYLQLSGHYDQLHALQADSVRNVLVAATRFDDWNKLSGEYEKYSNEWLEKNQGAAPGLLTKGKTLLEDPHVTVAADKKWVSFRLIYDSTARGPAGCLMFCKDSGLVAHESSLFKSHYEGMEQFEGYRYGLRFDKNEAGLYDYARNLLVAKYIWGITPSDHYIDSTAHEVTLEVRRSLLQDHLPAAGDFHMLPW